MTTPQPSKKRPAWGGDDFEPVPPQPTAGHTEGEVFVDRNHRGKVIGLAPCSGREHDLHMVCTFEQDAKEADAEHLALCWNSHADLVKALEQIVLAPACRCSVDDCAAIARAALLKATKP
jgi:hypothetical protein